VPFKIGAIAQVIVKVHAGIVDQEIERFDFPDSRLNLRSVGNVQGEGRDAPIGMCKGLARSCVHPLRPSPQGFLHQRPTDASVRTRDQNRLVFDVHTILLIARCPFY
jgi:hypothetical protein